LVISSAIGLCVSVLQAATQVQEASTLYLVKFIAVALVVLLLGGVAGRALCDFFIQGVALFGR
jgi:type III secretory pathway component EscS